MESLTTTCLISNYNYAHFVREAIEGALRQTVPFDEIIVIDDGSTDGSIEMLKSCYGGHPLVQIVCQEHEGQLACFNHGAARATGDIVFFLDADDIYEPEYVEQALRVYDLNPSCDFLFCGRRLFGQQESTELQYSEDRDFGYSVLNTACRRAWIGAPTSCLSMRRQILDRILPLPLVEEWHVRADDCLVFGASLAQARKRYLAQALVRYRVHEKNHFHGQLADKSAIYCRRLAINRLFEYLERKLCFNVDRLAEFHHREFCTIESPALGQLVNYLRIGMHAPISSFRQLACVAEMLRHYLRPPHHEKTMLRKDESISTDRPITLPFQLPVRNDSKSYLPSERQQRQRNRAA